MCTAKTTNCSGSLSFEDLPVEEGWELDCLRVPKVGEYVYSRASGYRKITEATDSFHIVIKRKVWEPAYGQQYYLVNTSSGTAISDRFDNATCDNDRIAIGNCFRTEEQAKEAAKRFKQMLADYQKELTHD